MLRLSFAIAFLVVCSTAVRAESLPSFHLPWAAQAASQVVVVEDGKIAEVWVGEAKIGEPFGTAVKPTTIEVSYSLFGDSPQIDKLIDEALEKKGLKRVPSVSGKRMVHFVLPDPPHIGVAQMISRSSDYTTAWLEEGQAFAVQQIMNPGPSEMRALELTEAQFKKGVLDSREVGNKLAAIQAEPDRAARAQVLVAMLRPENRWWNDPVRQAIQECGLSAWPAIEAALDDPKQAAAHHDLIQLAQAVAGIRAVPLFEKIVATETEYFRKLDASGQKYDRKSPPHWHHEQRRLTAQWAIEYSK